MIADAWYRQGSGPGEWSQQGPYQISFTGEALPPFAPHGRRSTTGYVFSSSGNRAQQCSRIRSQMSDGVTNTLFFDGHAAPVPSRRYMVGYFDVLYGFPGTVNPAKMNPPPESLYWSGVWQ
jgi:prepilin-type processing-associated H-X9-DG protein